jgi:hypothetical protein
MQHHRHPCELLQLAASRVSVMHDGAGPAQARRIMSHRADRAFVADRLKQARHLPASMTAAASPAARDDAGGQLLPSTQTRLRRSGSRSLRVFARASLTLLADVAGSVRPPSAHTGRGHCLRTGRTPRSPLNEHLTRPHLVQLARMESPLLYCLTSDANGRCQGRAPRCLPEVTLTPEGGRDTRSRPGSSQCAPGVPPTAPQSATRP